MAKKAKRRERAADRAEKKLHREAGFDVAGEPEFDTYEKERVIHHGLGGSDDGIKVPDDAIILENEGVTVTLDELAEKPERKVEKPVDPAGGYHWLPGANGEPVMVNGRNQFVGYWKDFDPPAVKAKRRAAEREEAERLRGIEVQKLWWAKQPPYWKPHHDLEIAHG